MTTVVRGADEIAKFVVVLETESDPSSTVGKTKEQVPGGEVLDELIGAKGPGVTVSATFVFFLHAF